MDLIASGELGLIGLIGGIMAGFLGIGGGIVIIPLLVYVAGIEVKLAMGISMVQALFATISGLLIHRRNRTVDIRLGVALGVAGVLGGLIGSFGSAYASGKFLLTVYFCLVAFSIFLLFAAPKDEKERETAVSLLLASPLGLAVGILAGMLGVGGGFIMTPLMISVLRIPTRTAVGTSLLMILPTTISGSIGKIATGQFNLEIAIVIIAGSILGAQFGGRMNAKIPPKAIRTVLTLLLFAILIRTGMDLIHT